MSAVPLPAGIRRGALVRVRRGDDRGQQGRITAVSVASGRVTVDGVNLVTRHVKPTKKLPHGGRMTVPAPIAVANVTVVCPSCSQPTRAVVHRSATTRELVCRRCHESLASKERL
jgi:large subunit ribosomal protein L24